MQKGASLFLLVMAVVLIVAGVLFLRGRTPPTPAPPGPSLAPETTKPLSTSPPSTALPIGETPRGLGDVTFGTPKKSAHFETSTPAHGTVLPAPPTHVVIDVNFDLVANSTISVTTGGKEYGVGSTTIDTNKLSMRRAVDAAAPDGRYVVKYTACWPDKSCHDGQFEFAIDRTQVSSAMDLRGTTAVTVDLKDIAFHPAAIRVSRGATITWTNRDAVEHYINTDAHPSHTYFPEQNSRVLTTGATYATAFRTPGAYPYHCSAHADTMRGVIIVE